jgi:DNA-binding MarR family transcriptional regulator
MTSSAPPSDLTSHLGYWLRFVSNHVSHAFARKLESRGVTVAEWVLLRHLWSEEPLAPARLAERMGATRGTITKLVDRLLGKGLVSREADASDGRAQILRLTPNGRRLVPTLARLADRNDAEFFDSLSSQDRKSLLRILRGLVEQSGLSTPPLD